MCLLFIMPTDVLILFYNTELNGVVLLLILHTFFRYVHCFK